MKYYNKKKKRDLKTSLFYIIYASSTFLLIFILLHILKYV